jgi:hypothetical protein
MWLEGKWFEECQLPVYLKAEREKSYREGYTVAVTVTADNFAVELQRLREERDAYKRELIDWLTKACECVMGNDTDCSICPYYDTVTNNVCPSKVSTYAAKLRLEELHNE